MPNTTVIQKTVGVRLSKEAMTRTKAGTLVTKGFFTSDNKDMHGDIITRSATEKAISRYRQWGNIRRMHQPDPVGKVLGIGVEDGLEWNEVKIEVINKQAADEVETGLLQALSIGAMINFEDITWLEDGGMLISDYLLGEISLVDHPGNYDAVLSSDKAAHTDVNLLIKRYGMDTLSKEMLAILEEKNPMSEKTDLEKDVLDEIEAEAIETEDVPVEEEDVETTKEIETEVEDATEVVEETEEAIEEEETDETTEEVDETPEEETDRLENIESQLAVLTDLVKSLVEKEAEVIEETVEKDQDTDEVDGDSEDAEVPTDAHKAVVPETDESTVIENDVEDDDATTRLHKALSARFHFNN